MHSEGETICVCAQIEISHGTLRLLFGSQVSIISDNNIIILVIKFCNWTRLIMVIVRVNLAIRAWNMIYSRNLNDMIWHFFRTVRRCSNVQHANMCIIAIVIVRSKLGQCTKPNAYAWKEAMAESCQMRLEQWPELYWN